MEGTLPPRRGQPWHAREDADPGLDARGARSLRAADWSGLSSLAHGRRALPLRPARGAGDRCSPREQRRGDAARGRLRSGSAPTSRRSGADPLDEEATAAAVRARSGASSGWTCWSTTPPARFATGGLRAAADGRLDRRPVGRDRRPHRRRGRRQGSRSCAAAGRGRARRGHPCRDWRTWPGRTRSSGRATRSAPTTIAPGDATTPEAVGGLVAFLASKAGDYYSGCRFSLGEAVPA